MAKRDHRPKASEIHAKADYLFAKKVGFDEAFPAVAEVVAEVESESSSHRTGMQRRLYSRSDFSEFVDCTNPLCFNGGVSLGNLLRTMVQKRETERKELLICQGYEGSPGGKRRYRDCLRSFSVLMKVTYK